MRQLLLRAALLLMFALGPHAPLALASSGDELQSLLEKPTRPTMSDVIGLVGLQPKSLPFERTPTANFSLAIEQIETLPKVIAAMEHMYPNAIWAPLGRDAVIFGDLLDAFYLSIGQADRVSRLNASGPSIRAADPSTLVRFLEQAGLDLNHLDRPFVGLDRTTFSESSQSRALLNAVYEKYAASGGAPLRLHRKVGFFGLAQTILKSHFASNFAESYFSKISEEKVLSQILQLPVGEWTDSTAWNDSFGAFSVSEDGRIEAKLGALEPLQKREIILNELVRILQIVTTFDFHNEVACEARRLGYSFPGIRLAEADYLAYLNREQEKNRHVQEQLMQLKNDHEQLLQTHSEKLSTIVRNLPTIDQERRTRIWDNSPNPHNFDSAAKKIYAAVESFSDAHGASLANIMDLDPETQPVPNSHIFMLHSIAETSVAFRERKIPETDFLKLIHLELKHLDPKDPQSIEYLGRILATEASLSDLLIRNEDYFLTYSLGDDLYKTLRSKFMTPIDFDARARRLVQTEGQKLLRLVDEYASEFNRQVSKARRKHPSIDILSGYFSQSLSEYRYLSGHLPNGSIKKNSDVFSDPADIGIRFLKLYEKSFRLGKIKRPDLIELSSKLLRQLKSENENFSSKFIDFIESESIFSQLAQELDVVDCETAFDLKAGA